MVENAQGSLARIEAAVRRIETALTRARLTAVDPAMDERHERLRAAAEEAVVAMDALIDRCAR